MTAGERRLPAPTVWAPLPDRVDLVLAGRRVAMRRDDDGWWRAGGDVAVAAGEDYAFLLDATEPPLPDPRSPWQPRGVHGPSRTLDHAAFEWHDVGWQPPPFERAVVYELHVGTFTPGGTFETAIERLEDLAALGITHVELMPVAEFAGQRGWGYDGVDLYAPHHAYGGPEGLKRFVDAAHRHGLAVLLDVVYNHLGPAGNYLPRFGPYLTDRYRVAWGDALNLDGPGSDEVRAFLIDNAIGWLRDYHVDGLRLDAVDVIVDRSALHILEELALAVGGLEAEVGRRLVLVAESDLNDPRLVGPRDAGGYGLDAQWLDDFHHALHTTLTGETHGYYADFEALPHLARALESGYVYTGQFARARGRRHGRERGSVPATRFVAFAQNHDQVGNRALGERLSQLVSPDALAVAAAVVLTSPYVPLLFQGEEWAASRPFFFFTDHEPDLGGAVRAGRHAEFAAFGWPEELFADPQSPETFERSKLDWTERTRGPHGRLLDWHRRLIALRRALPGLSDGRFAATHVDTEARSLVVDRGVVVAVCNFGERETDIVLPNDGRGLELRLASSDDIVWRGAGAPLSLPPTSAAVLVHGPSKEDRSMDTTPAGTEERSGGGGLERFRILGGGLDHPEGVAWDPAAGVVYAGGEAGQLYAVSLDGDVRQVASSGGFMLGVAVDGAGMVYGCDVGRAAVVRVDPRTGTVESYAEGTAERRMTAPNWLAFDERGRLYVTDSGNWGAADGFIWSIEPGGAAAVWTDASRLLPNGCCLDLDATSLFVIETNLPGVVRIPIRRDGSAGLRQVVVEMPGTTPDGIAVAADGTLVIACYRPDRIYAFRNGHLEILVDDPYGQMLGGPANVAFAGAGLDRLATSNLGRWHIAIGDVGLRGPGLPRPIVP